VWEFGDDEEEKKGQVESKDKPKESSGKSHRKERSHRDKGERSKKREKKPERKEKQEDPQKAKALRTIIHPSIEKVQKTVTDEKVIIALNELKSAFDMAESIQPGTTHNFIAQVIDALKRSAQQQQQ